MAIRLRFGLSLLLAVCAGHAAADTVVVPTDPSWQVLDAQGADLGAAAAVCGQVLPGCPWGWGLATEAQAEWIWAPGFSGSTSGASDARFSFVRTFEADVSAGSSAQLLLAADDRAEIRLNGSLVGVVGSVSDYGIAMDAHLRLHAFDVADDLRDGANTLVLTIDNGPAWFAGVPNPTYAQNPAGVLARLTIRSPASPVPEPERAGLLAAGVALLIARRSRRRERP